MDISTNDATKKEIARLMVSIERLVKQYGCDCRIYTMVDITTINN